MAPACKKAAAAGIKSIDYDRLTLGGGASYYVSFDNVKVGALHGRRASSSAWTTRARPRRNIVYINGDPTDNNAALFKQGYDDRAQAEDRLRQVQAASATRAGFWDATKAGTAFEQLYTQNERQDRRRRLGQRHDGRRHHRPASSADGLAGKVPVTGQDASVEGLQQILAGNQCMTVYKNTNLEADAASKLAIDLVKGDTAAADALATGSVKDTATDQAVKSVLATPVGDLPGHRQAGHLRRLPEGLGRLHRRVRRRTARSTASS